MKLPRWYLRTKAPFRRAMAILKRIAPLSAPVGCELGIHKADLSAIVLKEKPDLFLVMVDSWEGDGRAYTVTAGEGVAEYSDSEQERNYTTSLAVTEFAADRRKVCRMRTTEAAQHFPDEHFDYVFIDADHSYQGCMADIVAWNSKVKPGGWLCGHDYDNHYHPEFGVKKAVDEYCAQHKLVLEIDRNFTWFVRI